MTIIQGALSAVMLVLLAFLHVSSLGVPQPAVLVGSESFGNTPTGNLKVLVDPWAEVHIDGRLAETTPFSRPLRLTEGDHVVELRHPSFAPVRRVVRITPGTTELLRVALAPQGKP